MTLEQAINILEICVDGDDYIPISKHDEACRIAIKTMKRKACPCGWCKQFAGVPLRGFTMHGCESIVVKFCPNCGRNLEEQNDMSV